MINTRVKHHDSKDIYDVGIQMNYRKRFDNKRVRATSEVYVYDEDYYVCYNKGVFHFDINFTKLVRVYHD